MAGEHVYWQISFVVLPALVITVPFMSRHQEIYPVIVVTNILMDLYTVPEASIAVWLLHKSWPSKFRFSTSQHRWQGKEEGINHVLRIVAGVKVRLNGLG